MNKKKKNTRIKHRKSQRRVKKINQLSLKKAKPKKNVVKPESEMQPTNNETTKKATTKKTTTKKTTTKKATTKKTTTKKTTTKK